MARQTISQRVESRRSVQGRSWRRSGPWARWQRRGGPRLDLPKAVSHEPRSPYRDARGAFEERLRAARRSRTGTLARFVAAEAVLVRRRARQVPAMVALALLPLAMWVTLRGAPSLGHVALLLALGTTLLGWMVTGLAASAAARHRLRTRMAATGDPVADLARLEDRDALADLQRTTRRLELPALVLPLVAAALYLPLLVHLPAALLLGDGAAARSLHGGLSHPLLGSYLVLGHAHLLVAVLAVLFVRQLARGEVAPEHALAHGWRALLWAAVVTVIAGRAGASTTAIMVGLFGLAAIPALFARAADVLVAERAELGTLPAAS